MHKRSRILVVLATWLHCSSFFGGPIRADEPTQRVNRFMTDHWQELKVEPAEYASDAQWVRRVYLDLVGRIPTPEEAQNFVSDSRDDKHAALVDLLLDSEDYAQHFADVFDFLLMGRTDEKNYSQRAKHRWRSYLETVFRDNRPWDDVVAEFLLGRPKDDRDKGAAWFLFERKNKHQEIAEAVAPAVFGVRIECAQCHDHMMVDEIKQEHYWGLVAFFNRGKNEHTKNGPRVGESAIGGFSDFANIHGDSSPNVLSFLGANPVHEDRPGKDAKQEEKDELYLAATVKNEPRVPKFSRREKFVSEVVTQHPLIARAFVNRVWAMLLGRGIVHPFDEMDSEHPASQPELLQWLANGFEYSGFDIKRLVRTIALCDAYRRSSVRPENVDDPATFAWYLERPLSAEQLARSVQQSLRGEFQNDHVLVKQLRQKFTDVMPEEYVSTVKDTLYMTNNSHLNGFIHLSAKEDDMIGRMLKMETHDQRVDYAFTTIYGREAAESESTEIKKYLDRRSEKLRDALEQVIWAMLTSAEFQFNH